MSILPSFLRSVLLTSVLSFVAPILLFGGALVSLALLAYIPGLEGSGLVAEQILQFLATFGSGNRFGGLAVISLTCSIVGVLFDMYVFYRCQSMR